MIKIGIIGYGRMGKTIESLAETQGCTVHAIIKEEKDWHDSLIGQCDVAIDFSLPKSAFENISKCIRLGIPIVSGTTGWLDKLEDLKEILKENPSSAFLYGSNFSLGMQMFFLLNKKLSILMQPLDYDISLIETHHTKKLDAPSGTALSLAEDIMGINQEFKSWKNDQSNDKTILGIESIRKPDVPGTHTIKYENDIDSIEITHTAKSRVGFASGAIQSAKWLVENDKSGYFTVGDYVAELLSLSL